MRAHIAGYEETTHYEQEAYAPVVGYGEESGAALHELLNNISEYDRVYCDRLGTNDSDEAFLRRYITSRGVDVEYADGEVAPAVHTVACRQ
jgi:hypothetical protein